MNPVLRPKPVQRRQTRSASSFRDSWQLSRMMLRFAALA